MKKANLIVRVVVTTTDSKRGYLVAENHLNRVGFPLYDLQVRAEIRQFIAFQLADNTKACLIDQQGNNQPIRDRTAPQVRAKLAMYDWLKPKDT